MKKRILLLAVTFCVLIAGCAAAKPTPQAAETTPASSAVEQSGETSGPGAGMSLDELYFTYIRPLGLTTIIGMPWASPAEIDPDDVLITMEIRLVENKELMEKYLSEDNQYLIFPKSEVEAYAARYFGMTPEQIGKADSFDAEKQSYVVMLGLGGAWDVAATGWESANGLLKLHYNLINSTGEVDGAGTLNIRQNEDGTYQYLSNEQEPGAWEKSNES